MTQEKEITNLEQMLDRIGKSAEGKESASLGTVVEAVGARSFGPLLLMAGIVIASPLSGIPTVPTTMGLLVLLIAGQMLFRRRYFWLPRWLLDRSVEREKFAKALKWLRPPARFIDRLIRPRLPVFIEGAAAYIIAITCVLIAASLPLMEFVPFSAHGAGLALTAFGLSLIARDGLLALIAFAVTAITYGVVLYHMLT
jgi:hypothetical protein